ncbi:MAG: N-acetylmuramoyl-L-alanine amidase [Thermonemataceae bacterium]|nr:N-acetylmuramoyl-L-alanine amidase [Thermonemataceae bacterium]
MGLLDFKNTLQQVKKDLLEKPKDALLGNRDKEEKPITFRKEIKVICIDPGHGDKCLLEKELGDRALDVGTFRNYGGEIYYEKDLVLPISLALKNELENLGYEVIITRKEDKVVNDIKYVWRLKEAKNCDLFISIHIDARGASEQDCKDGLLILYFSGSFTVKNIQDNKENGQVIPTSAKQLSLKEQSGTLADFIINNQIVRTLFKNPKRAATNNVLRNFGGIASVIVEIGNIDCSEDLSLLMGDSELIGKDIAKGIHSYALDYKQKD